MSGKKPSDVEDAVLRANAEFYRAFSQADFAAMNALWAEHAPVLCSHPGSQVLVGRALVLDSWRQILQEEAAFELRCEEPRVHVFGDVAIVSCYEGSEAHPAHLAATNVFVLEAERWRMVHHHAGPLARPVSQPVPPADMN